MARTLWCIALVAAIIFGMVGLLVPVFVCCRAGPDGLTGWHVLITSLSGIWLAAVMGSTLIGLPNPRQWLWWVSLPSLIFGLLYIVSATVPSVRNYAERLFGDQHTHWLDLYLALGAALVGVGLGLMLAHLKRQWCSATMAERSHQPAGRDADRTARPCQPNTTPEGCSIWGILFLIAGCVSGFLRRGRTARSRGGRRSST